MHAGQLLRRLGLHPGQEPVVMQLWQLGARRQADLVRLLDSDAATMTRTVRRLEQAGFVRGRPAPADRRAALVGPSAAGVDSPAPGWQEPATGRTASVSADDFGGQ